MESVCDEVGISRSHLKETVSADRFVLICNKNWLRLLKLEKKIYDFPIYKPNDRKLLPELGHPWTKTFVQIFKKSNHKVLPLPKTPRNEDEIGTSQPIMSYSEIINYVSYTNYRNLWEIGYKQYNGSHVKYAKQHQTPNGSQVGAGAVQSSSKRTSNLETGSHLIQYDVVLKELIQRVFQCSVIHSKLDRVKSPLAPEPQCVSAKDESNEDDCHQNVLSALIAIETSACILVIFYPPSVECTLYDCITYSPAILNKTHNKSMFILYQILQLLKHLHSQNVLLGDIHLSDIYLHENLWLQIIPKLESNLIKFEAEMETSGLTDSPQEESLKFDLKFIYDVGNFSLREYCEMWCNGQLSNFDYLTILNQAAGRRIGLPGNHHIMPWVSDFFQRNGANWRDLTKSKYRINKGDAHLDLIYSTAAAVAGGLEAHGFANSAGIISLGSNVNAVPHHVSDFLSEITYFVYMARRTPQNVLCQHVRPIWVPAEYPVSIQRLQEWTPDECIPEFYSDPMVFKSIHEDLPDLEVPPWATCPEDFVAKHREALESQYVSERLQYWIDLNFGYKLSGKAAIKSKNVSLCLVDNHKNLTQRGIVQLFNHPHPPKRFPSQWFGRVAPRLLTVEQQKRRLARSTDNLTALSMNHETSLTTSNPSTSFSPQQRHSRGDPSPHRRLNQQQQKLSAHQGSSLNLSEEANFGIERSTSVYQNLANLIQLPKDYNPLALLNSLENMEIFFSKTFLDQKPSKSQEEKLEQNDMLFEESSDNSYTNRMFTESFESATSKLPKNGKPFIMGLSCPKDFKQVFEDKKEKELQVVGCIVAEIFLMNRLRPLTMNSCNITFAKRFSACRAVVSKFISEIPKSLHYAVKLFLGLDDNTHAIISDKGLPRPTAAMLIEPFMTNLIIPFPLHYYRVYLLFKSLHNFDINSMLLDLYTHFSCDGKNCDRYADLDKKRVVIGRKIADCKVKTCCKLIDGLLDPVGYEQFVSVELLLQLVIDMLKTEETSILAAWNLFDPIAAALGIKDTQKYFLHPILRLYDPETEESSTENNKDVENNSHMKFRTSSSFKARKSVKLYHHSFLLRLMVRFGLKCFLDNFIPPLIEAVGGFKEPIESSGYHYHSNKFNSMFSRSVRSTKNLKLSFNPDENSDNSLTLISPDHSDLKSDPTISMCESSLPAAVTQTQQLSKNDIEDVFAFETELMDDNCDNRSTKSNIESRSLDSFELPLGATKAEEATEDVILFAEKLALNDIFYGGRLSNNSFDDDKISINSQKDSPQKSDAMGPTSPTIPIPTTFRRTYELSTIDCVIGSKKSIDSFDFGTPAPFNTSLSLKSNLESADSPSDTVDHGKEENCDEESFADSLQASVISKRAELLSAHDNKISEMSTESIIWLSHRLGPVLTSKYLTRNLLRMLTLCYTGQENLLPPSEELQNADDCGNLNFFSVVDAKVVGDRCAARVLECLTQIAALFGDQFILLQYLPHVSELIALCKNRITASLEGALISSLQLLKFLIPCLNDSAIMEHLQDLILENIVNPVLSLLSSTRCLMASGYLGRSVLARKLLDAIYVICVRIGAEMSKEHICPNVLQKFFLIFDKAYGIRENYELLYDNNVKITGNKIRENQLNISPYRNYIDETMDENEVQAQERGLEEIRDVFSPNLAHSAYLAFLRYLGESIMHKTILNLEFILTLCHEFEQPDYSVDMDRQKRRQIFGNSRANHSNSGSDNSFDEFHGSHSFGTLVVGNRIEVVKPSSTKTEVGPMEVLDMVAHKFDNINTKRNLKGNWLAYWRHEISRSEKDNHLSIKQIKLQTFSGHTNSVRAITSLDNENSFMSASKDKTVKLWSLRSEGDGTKITPCQFTYSSHKKSVHSLAFSEAMRFVISCDSGVHIWDPFIGRPIGILDSHRHSPVSVVRTYPSPSPLVIAGTADSCVRIIDSRVVEYVNEWKVTSNQNSIVRCLACSPSGNWIAIGLSSGHIILLDARTGVVLRSWKATEGELLNLIAINDQQVISSCLDYSISVWNVNDNHVQYHLKQPPEPAHCLCPNGTELVFGTPANRIGVYSDLNSNDAAYNIIRLRSETLRGVMTSLAVLPLNRMVLAGTDSGNIILLC